MENKRKNILYISVGVAFVFALFLIVSYFLPSTVGISEHADAKTCDPFRKMLASQSGFSLARPKSDYHIMSPFEAVSVKYIASARLFSQVFEIIFFFLRFFEK